MFILVHSRSNIYLYTSSYLIIKSCACTLFDSWPEKKEELIDIHTSTLDRKLPE